MSVHSSSIDLLKEIYEACNQHGSFNVIRSTYDELSSEDRNQLEQYIEYLKDSNFIINHAPCMGIPISVKMSSKGIREIEGIQNDNKQITNVYGANYGIIGNNNASNTISNNFSFQDIKNVISDCTESPDEAALLESELKPLYDRIELGAPIEKGMLAKISAQLQNYQPLLSAVINSITNYLISTK